MKEGATRNARSRAIAVTTVVALAASLGCATAGRDLSRDGVVAVERVSSPHARVSQVYVHEAEPGMTVYGELRKRPAAPWTLPGHVEVQVLGPQDTVLEQIKTSYHRKDKRSRRVWFRVEVPAVPPKGSTVRITHRPAG